VGEKGRRERDVSSSSACHLSPVSHLHQTSLVVEFHNSNLLTIHCVYTLPTHRSTCFQLLLSQFNGNLAKLVPTDSDSGGCCAWKPAFPAASPSSVVWVLYVVYRE
jgi:hypothetical protein